MEGRYPLIKDFAKERGENWKRCPRGQHNVHNFLMVVQNSTVDRNCLNDDDDEIYKKNIHGHATEFNTSCQ